VTKTDEFADIKGVARVKAELVIEVGGPSFLEKRRDQIVPV